MPKQRIAQLLTIVILLGALSVAAWRKGAFNTARVPKPDPTPQDAIYAMLDAAREGNAAKYLSFYTGQMQSSLAQTQAEQGNEAFSRYLKESNAAIKGVALQEPQALTDREVKVRVEYVYQDRNEVQQMYLEKSGNDWKITRVDSAERIKTLVPYGTPVR